MFAPDVFPFRNVALGIETYSRELETTVTALGGGALLLEMKVAKLTTGSLDHTGDVGLGVVSREQRIGQPDCLFPHLLSLFQELQMSCVADKVYSRWGVVDGG